MIYPYKRVAVIGCPGGGKSTFSRRLRDCVGLPLYHLDALYWRADRTTLPREEFYPIQREIIQRESWIIDGNYQSTMEWRIAACDLVVFLDLPTEVCLEGVRTRLGHPRSDLPWVEEGEDEAFTAFITAFETDTRPLILGLLEQYPHKPVLIFRTRAEADEYLKRLTRS